MNGDFSSNGGNNVNNPLAHLNDSVNSLDPLNAMEKSLNDQVRISCNQLAWQTFWPSYYFRCHTPLIHHTHQTVAIIPWRLAVRLLCHQSMTCRTAPVIQTTPTHLSTSRIFWIQRQTLWTHRKVSWTRRRTWWTLLKTWIRTCSKT